MSIVACRSQLEPDYMTSDGWEDDLDRFYDLCAKSEDLEKNWFSYLEFFEHDKLRPGADEYYPSVCRSRGYDPIPHDYRDRFCKSLDLKYIDDGDQYSDRRNLTLSQEGAELSLLYHNRQKSTHLKFVKLIKVYRHNTRDPAADFFYITFEAQEAGNSDTRKQYQTRVRIGFDRGIIKLCSFRPKPQGSIELSC